MKTATYPALGSKVSYVRYNEKQELDQGEAFVIAISLNHDKRIMTLLTKEPGNHQAPKFNVDINLLNPSAEAVEKFVTNTNTIKALSEEGNGKVKELVAEYNQKVDAQYAEILSVPVSFEGLETVQ